MENIRPIHTNKSTYSSDVGRPVVGKSNISSAGEGSLEKLQSAYYSERTSDFGAQQLDRKQLREQPLLKRTNEKAGQEIKKAVSGLVDHGLVAKNTKFMHAIHSFQERMARHEKFQDKEKIQGDITYTEKMLEQTEDPELEALYSTQKAQLEKFLELLD